MNKPTIFFSHSSFDKVALGRLKSKIHEYTGGTIDVFLSGDGQSIPFGRNWVHSIEEALNRSKIMFVFISPISMQSHWVYFESGYSYSKGIEVIPIGISGMDLNQIPSPLNLLQGFNLKSKDGLNNIIDIINKKFEFTHKENFTDADFTDIFINNEADQLEYIGESYRFIDHIELSFDHRIKTHDGKELVLKDNFHEEIKNYLIENDVEFGTSKRAFFLNGCKIDYKVGTESSPANSITMRVDTVLAKRNLTLISCLIDRLYSGNLERYFFRVKFNKKTSIITEDFKISSRLSSSGVTIFDQNGMLLKYKNICFAIDEEKYNSMGKMIMGPTLRVLCNIDEFKDVPIQELFEILVKNGIVS